MGYYELREEAPPAGYLITADSSPIAFEVKADGTIGPAGSEQTTVKYYDPRNKTFTIPNIPGQELPQTGGSGTALYELIGGLMMTTAGAALILRKRESKA